MMPQTNNDGVQQPFPVQGNQPSVPSQGSQPLKFPQQGAVNKVANATSNAEAQRTGNVPRNASSQVSGKVRSDDIEKLRQSPDARNVKEQKQQTSSFLSRIPAYISKLFSYLNPMAYFNKNKGNAVAAQPQATAAVAQPTFVKASPDQLSAGAKKLTAFMLSKPEMFKEEGIFRLSGRERDKTDLFNKLMTSPESVELAEVDDPHVLTGVLKHIYRDMNLFGGNPDQIAKFKETGNTLLETPDEKTVIALLKDLKGSLPIGRQEDLKNFIQVLAKASESSEVSLMGVSNLAVVGGPNLYVTNDTTILDLRQEIAHQFIAHYDKVFTG